MGPARATRLALLAHVIASLPCRTAHYNLAKLRDVYLHTNTLAALANLAPHMSGEGRRACPSGARLEAAFRARRRSRCAQACNCLRHSALPPRPGCRAVAGMSTHAAQRLVSLFHLLARRYNRLQAAAEGAAMPPTPTAASAAAGSPTAPWLPAPTPQQQALQGTHEASQQQHQQQAEQHHAHQQLEQQAPAGTRGAVSEQQQLELQLYADFLRIVLEVRALKQEAQGWVRRGVIWAVGPGRGCPTCWLPAAACPASQIINSILTSSLARNPELVYTLLHRQARPALHCWDAHGLLVCCWRQRADKLAGAWRREHRRVPSLQPSCHALRPPALAPQASRRCLRPLRTTRATRNSWRTSPASPTTSTGGWRSTWRRGAARS